MSIVISGTDGITPLKATNGSAAAPSVTGTDTDTGLFFGTNEVNIATGGTERVKVDSSGNVGIGTSSIDGSLHVKGANTHGSLVLEAGGTTGSTNLIYLQGHNNAGTAIGEIAFDETATNQGAIVFKTNGGTLTERMRIKQNGIIQGPQIYANTDAIAANVFVLSNGDLGRSTSSIKYKRDVETLEDSYADAILNCRPVWYRSKSENSNPGWGFWGFIAEEVAEIDPRLVHWKTVEVTYDNKGSIVETPCEQEPESVQYDRFVPHLLNLIKRQQAAIETLEAKVAALEGGAS